jgi:hypothetical protein
MAGAYAGLARGVEAAAWNPALLGLTEQPRLSISLPTLDASATMLGPNLLDMYDVMRKGPNLTDRDRQDLLAAIPGSGLELRGNARGSWAGFATGNLAFGFSTTGMVSGNFGKEFVDLLLYVRQYEDIDYSRLGDYRVGNTIARGIGYSTISAAYGRSLDLALLPFPLSIGVGARYIHGHELQRGRIFEPTVDLAAQDIEISALALRSRGGKGYALDLGLAAEPIPGLTLSLALENLVQRMTWDKELELRGQSFSGKELSEMDFGDLLDRFEPRPFDPNSAELGAYELARGFFHQSFFPRIIRAGVGYQSRLTGTRFGATFSTTQGDGDLHTGWPRYAALGAEQQLPILSFLTVRGGYATSLAGASALTGGLGIGMGPVNLNTALTLSNGHGKGITGTDPNRHRFAEQLAAGSGIGFLIGLDLAIF